MCVSCIAPAKTNAQGYRHADYALPDTRVFVSHLSQIFLPNRWNQKILPDCPVLFWLVRGSAHEMRILLTELLETEKTPTND